MLFGNEMCIIIHFRITYDGTTPILTPKCVLYYTFEFTENPFLSDQLEMLSGICQTISGDRRQCRVLH
jgi:hypothetical protein